MQARLCYRPIAYGKALTWPIGTRHNVARVLSIDSIFLSKDIARYRKIGLTQLSTPANRIERYLRPTFDTFYRIVDMAIRFDFSKPLIPEFVLTFTKPLIPHLVLSFFVLVCSFQSCYLSFLFKKEKEHDKTKQNIARG
jgi:hypothetical protein